MLSKFRTKHIKLILWCLLILIIPAFVLWGGMAYFKDKDKKAIGKIGNKILTEADFMYYFNMAKLNYLLLPMLGQQDQINAEDVTGKAWEYVLLLWKANKENIRVSDGEVVGILKQMFSPQGKFDKQIYNRFVKKVLRMKARAYEEYLREFIKIEKLFKKNIGDEIKIEDKQINALYKRDNQKAKIGYIFLSYDPFKKSVTSNEKILKEFYEKNKAAFKEKEEEVIPEFKQIKNKIKKAFIKEKAIEMAHKKCAKLLQTIKEEKIQNLKEFAKKENLNYKNTEFFKFNEDIEGFEVDKTISQLAFSMKKGEIFNNPIVLKKGSYIIQLTDMSPVDKKQFEEKKKIYEANLYEQKFLIEKLKFMSSLEQESELKIYR